MHAYLLINSEPDKLSKRLQAKILNFPVKKIEDTRELNNLLRLSFSEPTLIVCQDIHLATEEALNAFLKNLEEPQKNVYFALTSPDTRKVLPTIVSRCQIVKDKSPKIEIRDQKEIESFLAMETSQRLGFFDKMKDRNKATVFIESLVFYLHEKKDFGNMNLLLKTLTRLKANGNVNLHLSNLAINYHG